MCCDSNGWPHHPSLPNFPFWNEYFPAPLYPASFGSALVIMKGLPRKMYSSQNIFWTKRWSNTRPFEMSVNWPLQPCRCGLPMRNQNECTSGWCTSEAAVLKSMVTWWGVTRQKTLIRPERARLITSSSGAGSVIDQTGYRDSVVWALWWGRGEHWCG